MHRYYITHPQAASAWLQFFFTLSLKSSSCNTWNASPSVCNHVEYAILPNIIIPNLVGIKVSMPNATPCKFQYSNLHCQSGFKVSNMSLPLSFDPLYRIFEQDVSVLAVSSICKEDIKWHPSTHP